MLEVQHKDALNEKKSLTVELQNSHAILKANLSQKEEELKASHKRYVHVYIHTSLFNSDLLNSLFRTICIFKCLLLLKHFK